MELLGWGAGGIQALKEDRRQDATLELNRIAMSVESAKAQREQQELELDRQVGKELYSIAEGNGGSPQVVGESSGNPADALDRAGNIYMRAGAVKRATDAFEAASKIRENQQQATSAEARTRSAAAELQIKQTDLFSRYLGTAGNADTWDHGLDQLEQSGMFKPEEMERLRSLPFSPQVRDLMNQQALSSKERASLILQEDSNSIREQSRLDALQRGQAQVEISRARLRAYEDRTRAAAKAGGDKVDTAPTSAELETVDAILTKEVFGGEIPEASSTDFDVARQTVASRARELVRADRSLTWDRAAEQAVLEAQAAGDFPINDGGWLSRAHPEYKPKGRTAQTALPIPKGGKSAMVSGRYYTAPDGRVGKWNGTAFEIIE